MSPTNRRTALAALAGLAALPLLARRQSAAEGGGPVVVEAMDGSTVKDIRGNVTVNSYGDGGVQLIGYNVPDLRDGIPDGTNDPLTGDPVLNFTDINGDGLWGRYDSNNDTVIDATDHASGANPYYR